MKYICLGFIDREVRELSEAETKLNMD